MSEAISEALAERYHDRHATFETPCESNAIEPLPARRSSRRNIMHVRSFGRVLLASALALTLSTTAAYAQAGQDMKDAGHATKDAAIDTGHATKVVAHKTAHGTKKVYHKTAHGTKVAAHKTGEGAETVGHDTKKVAKKTWHGTENLGDKIADKPATH
jgi:hypothetical protein